ncbi:MAG: hypothetical protein E6K82_02565 [Candidatus Rokuibacteriota bacterium]|nr:MAG: hypothetical protein E6K82_02565 [Candidatus Rokubacteria bacterium]
MNTPVSGAAAGLWMEEGAMDRFENAARIVAVAVGAIMLAFVSADRWWPVLGLAPLAMGLSGW